MPISRAGCSVKTLVGNISPMRPPEIGRILQAGFSDAIPKATELGIRSRNIEDA